VHSPTHPSAFGLASDANTWTLNIIQATNASTRYNLFPINNLLFYKINNRQKCEEMQDFFSSDPIVEILKRKNNLNAQKTLILT
jgi:hypothetical protein